MDQTYDRKICHVFTSYFKVEYTKYSALFFLSSIGTLNGLYLWLCQRLFSRKQFAKVQPLLNVILAAKLPITQSILYDCVKTANPSLTQEDFNRQLHLLRRVISVSRAGALMLFHHSFAEWLLDVKHCTQKYLCSAAEGT